MQTLSLDSLKDRINQQYIQLGHDQCWSFLYTPAKTLNPDARFLFMGLNPGGSWDGSDPQISTEEGNAYNPEIEQWGENGGSPLQNQMVKLYELLSKDLKVDNYKELMNATLAANFCPFRSKDWAELKNKDATLSFCMEMWGDLIRQINVTTILCMSTLVYRQIAEILKKQGGRLVGDPQTEPVGWGKINYYVSNFEINGRNVLVLCLPHLSRYQIFSSDKCTEQVKTIIALLSTSLAGWMPER